MISRDPPPHLADKDKWSLPMHDFCAQCLQKEAKVPPKRNPPETESPPALSLPPPIPILSPPDFYSSLLSVSFLLHPLPSFSQTFRLSLTPTAPWLSANLILLLTPCPASSSREAASSAQVHPRRLPGLPVLPLPHAHPACSSSSATLSVILSGCWSPVLSPPLLNDLPIRHICLFPLLSHVVGLSSVFPSILLLFAKPPHPPFPPCLPLDWPCHDHFSSIPPWSNIRAPCGCPSSSLPVSPLTEFPAIP